MTPRELRLFRRWHGVGMPHEFVGTRPVGERYEWRAPLMRGRSGVPHTIITSYHVTESQAPILRGELMTILRVIWWKNKVVFDRGYQVLPILLLSVRPGSFRLIEAFHNGSKFVLRYGKPVPVKLTDPMEHRMEGV
ncbi:hypothetical protein RJZ56_001496 [Blastomyces dermatitidis]|nr:hypothetical protein BDFG_05744 [Blastomyces dermatitidis ATCC 26199]